MVLLVLEGGRVLGGVDGQHESEVVEEVGLGGDPDKMDVEMILKLHL